VKSQASHLTMLKETILPDTEAVILLDFSKNYSFLHQDAIQGFHWQIDEATLHPFTVYYCTSAPEGTRERQISVSSILFWVYSNYCPLFHKLQHTWLGFWCSTAFKEDVYYFGDGESSQHKNCKEFLNLRDENFHVSDEWNFFATSCSKSRYNGNGGTVMQPVVCTSLQET
jgi:hypothetical protein